LRRIEYVSIEQFWNLRYAANGRLGNQHWDADDSGCSYARLGLGRHGDKRGELNAGVARFGPTAAPTTSLSIFT
jgi:hypothetical protein